MNTNAKIAQRYALKGLAVYPAKGKVPILPGGINSATKDPTIIENLWDHYPTANVGIATGPISNLLVLDIDVDKNTGKDGFYSIRSWEKEHGTFPDTVSDITGRKGSHLLYRYDGNDIKSTIDLADGVDIRSTGAGIIVPPSIHENGNHYEWETSPDDMDIAPADDNVIAFIRYHEQLKKQKTNAPFNNKLECRHNEARKPDYYQSVIHEGHRNDHLFRLASSLQAKGLSDEAIFIAIKTENEIKCIPPLPEKEIASILKSALRYSKGVIVQMPEIPTNTAKGLLKSLNEFTEKEADWLISPYMPQGKICLVAGDGGTGKTIIWIYLAAAISRGEAPEFWPDAKINSNGNHKVLFFSTEDDTDTVLMRRFRKAGAVKDNLKTIGLDDPRLSQIKFGSKILEDIIKEYKPALCIFDPIQSFLPAKVKMSERNAMRQALEPLNQYGAKYGTTFLIIVHTNKQGNTYGRTRIADSSDLWDFARSVFIAGATPKDDTIKYFSHEKSNYSALGSTVLYSIDDEVIVQQGITDKRDKDFIQDRQKSKSSITKEDAENAVVKYLRDRGECPVNELDQAVMDAGISANALRKAKQDLKEDGTIRYRKLADGQANGVKWNVYLDG